MMTIAEDAPHPRYVICNADEMEPGTFKDRVLIHADPHMLIEGIILAAWSVHADRGIIFIRPEYENAARILERELGSPKNTVTSAATSWARITSLKSSYTAAPAAISAAR